MEPVLSSVTPGSAGLSPQLVEIPTIGDESGFLSVVEPRGCLPFSPERLYYIYSVRPGLERGAHAHRDLHQFMMCLSGSFRIHLEGGGQTFEFHLAVPSQGLYIPPGYWRNLYAFEDRTVCAVLASDQYNEADYIRDYGAFKEWEALA